MISTKKSVHPLYVVRWMLAGTLFGLFFPLVAWRIAVAESGALSFAELHSLHPILWIVDLAPTVLGLGGAVIGVLYSRLADSKARTEATARQIAAGWTAELHKANVELADTLEAKRRFHAAMTHELRTPLTTIVGFTGLAEGVAHEPPELPGYLAEIYGAATAMLGMVNDLLDSAKLETGGIPIELGRVNCTEAISEVVTRMMPLARQKGLDIVVDADPRIDCRADITRLRQVLTNIVANSIKYSSSGTITLKVYSDSDDTSVLDVTDQGMGIAQEDLVRVFDAFESGANGIGRTDSSGLGLAISGALIDAMDGTITAHSDGPGTGSTFRITLPAPNNRGKESRIASLAVT